MCRCCEVVTARTTQVATVTARTTQVATETVTEAVDAGTPTAAVAVPAVIIALITVIIIVVVIWLLRRRLYRHSREHELPELP